MKEPNFAHSAKWASCLRRVKRTDIYKFEKKQPRADDVVICRVEHSVFPHSAIEDCWGRLQSVFPGDLLFTTVSARESTRWSVGVVPTSSVYEGEYLLSILSIQGIIGELVELGTEADGIETTIRVLGVAVTEEGKSINIADYAVEFNYPTVRHSLPCTVLITGSSAEAGKTTAGIAAVRSLRREGYSVIAFKATGTASFIERQIYLDAGASTALDTIDFGLSTTYPSGLNYIADKFLLWLNYLCQQDCDALVIECGGDPIGANVPALIAALAEYGAPHLHISAASDCTAALGLKTLFSTAGPFVDFFCGRCTDTQMLLERTVMLTGTPSINLAGGNGCEVLAAKLKEVMLTDKQEK